MGAGRCGFTKERQARDVDGYRWSATPEALEAADNPERHKSRVINFLKVYLKRAGLTPDRRHDGMPIRWHDLRHTCASWMVSGWIGGRRWGLEEVQALLGHAEHKMTERSAHLAQSALEKAALETAEGLAREQVALDRAQTLALERAALERADALSREDVGRLNDPTKSSFPDVNDLSTRNLGAGHEIRTRDFQLGKLALYQLS